MSLTLQLQGGSDPIKVAPVIPGMDGIQDPRHSKLVSRSNIALQDKPLKLISLPLLLPPEISREGIPQQRVFAELR